MLDLSKLESGSLNLSVKEANLTGALKQMIAAFEFQAREKQIEFSSEVAEIEKAYFDHDVLEKIVSNLLSNAIKYTPASGRIKIQSSIKSGLLILSVTNSGNTLSSDDLPKLFQRFYQTSKNSDGVGIGLALVKELAILSHGQVVANISSPDDIQFTVTLPIERSYYNSSEIIVPEIPKETHTKLPLEEVGIENEDEVNSELPILLIIEDDKDICKYVASIFNDGYTILEAYNGETGIDLAVAHLPDLIISDIMMPGINGLEVCQRVKKDERTSHIPLILLTAKAGETHEIAGIETGADAYVTKPFSSKKLQIQVDQLIKMRRQLQKRYSTTSDINPKAIAVSSADEKFFERVQKVLEELLTDPGFTADRFASEMTMSRMQLHRKLKALTGLSTTEFIRSQRLKIASKMIRETDLTISELAYEIGFNTPSYFIKCFKETFGVTPLEFQNQG